MSGAYLFQGDDPLFRPFISGQILILQVIGEPTKCNYESKQLEYNRLRNQIEQLGLAHLIFDLSRVKAIDSVVIGIMVSLTKSVRARSGDAVVVGMTDDLRRAIVRMMRLEHQRRRVGWKSYSSVSRAVECFPWPGRVATP